VFRYGLPPIITAAEEGNSIIMALLIQAGADVHKEDEHGMTPIDRALRSSTEYGNQRVEEYEKCIEMLEYAAS